MALAAPAVAGIAAIGPGSPPGAGGAIVTAGITPGDTTSAFLNLDFTRMAPIAVAIGTSSASAMATHGGAINDTGSTWTAFSVRVVAISTLAP